MIFGPDGIIPDSGLSEPNDIYIYIYIYICVCVCVCVCACVCVCVSVRVCVIVIQRIRGFIYFLKKR